MRFVFAMLVVRPGDRRVYRRRLKSRRPFPHQRNAESGSTVYDGEPSRGSDLLTCWVSASAGNTGPIRLDESTEALGLIEPPSAILGFRQASHVENRVLDTIRVGEAWKSWHTPL